MSGDSVWRMFARALTLFVSVVLLSWLGKTGEDAVGLFGRVDVWVCAVIASVPLAAHAISCTRQLTSTRRLAIAAGLASMSGFLIMLAANMPPAGTGGELSLAVWRALIALPAATASMFIAGAGRGGGSAPSAPELPPWAYRTALAVAALLVPAVYADAVADNLRDHLNQSLETGRAALAHQQACQLRQLKPAWQVRGASIQRLERDLAERVERLAAEAALPLSPEASAAQLGRRITVLVQLERPREALAWIEPLTEGERFHPTALDYRGLCYQRLDQSSESLRAYREALRYWGKQSDGRAKRRGLASAWKGMGFAARRLEDRTLEERAYRRLVDIAPTAESHLLLAQCYREHQKSALAARHANRSVELDSSFAERAETILSSLRQDHFGCFLLPRH